MDKFSFLMQRRLSSIPHLIMYDSGASISEENFDLRQMTQKYDFTFWKEMTSSRIMERDGNRKIETER